MLLIYGADIGSLALALILEQQGIDYRLIDPRPTLERDEEGCDPPLLSGGVVLFPPALELLAQLGLQDDIWFESHPLLQVKVFEHHWNLQKRDESFLISSLQHSRPSSEVHSLSNIPAAARSQSTCMPSKKLTAQTCATARLSPSKILDAVGHLDFSRWRSRYDSARPLDCRVIDRGILVDLLLSRVPAHRIHLSKSLCSVQTLSARDKITAGVGEYKKLCEQSTSSQDPFSTCSLRCRFSDGSEETAHLFVTSHVGNGLLLPERYKGIIHDSSSPPTPFPPLPLSSSRACSEKQRLCFDGRASSFATTTAALTSSSCAIAPSFTALSEPHPFIQPHGQTCEHFSSVSDSKRSSLAFNIEKPPASLQGEHVFVVVQGVTDRVDTQRFPLVRDESAHFRLVGEDMGGYSWWACTLVDFRVAWRISRRMHRSAVQPAVSPMISPRQEQEYTTKHDHYRHGRQYAALQEQLLQDFSDLPCPLGAYMGDLFRNTPASSMSVLVSDGEHELQPTETSALAIIQLAGGSQLTSITGEDVDFAIMEAALVAHTLQLHLDQCEPSHECAIVLARSIRQQQDILYRRVSSWYNRIEQYMESQTIWQRIRRWLALNFMPSCLQDRLDAQRLLDYIPLRYVDIVS